MKKFKEAIMSLFRWPSKHQLIEKKVDEDFAEVDRLSVAEAYKLVIKEIDKNDSIKARKSKVGSSVPSSEMDAISSSFFQAYEEVYLVDTDSRIKVFEDQPPSDPRGKLVCKCPQDDFELWLERGGAAVVAYQGNIRMDDFKSIFHYILVSI